MPAATVFVSSIAVHAQRAFGGTYNQKKTFSYFSGDFASTRFCFTKVFFVPR